MCHRDRHLRPFCTLVPAGFLLRLLETGDENERVAAAVTLSFDITNRSRRAAILAAPRPPAAPKLAALPVPHKQRTIYDARNGFILPGQEVRGEGNQYNGNDPRVIEAYVGLGKTFDFFWQVFERNSLDDDGRSLVASVHYLDRYNNAFWDGQRMIFGDGDGSIFNPFTISIDIIAHELGHAVTEDEARLIYEGQSGALNESMSDVFGSMVKQWVLGHNATQADWLIGEGLLTNQVNGRALRSMKDPGSAFDDPKLGKDPQPKHMNQYYEGPEDNYGVHINSGIPNYAFYLAAQQFGGNSWDRTGRIWYDTLRDPELLPSASFRQFAQLTVKNAGLRYGIGSNEQQVVQGAWAQVGVMLSEGQVVQAAI